MPDVRQLYSQSWDTGLRLNRGIYSLQLIASYSHTKDLNFDPSKGRYGLASALDDVQQYNLQWGNTLAVGYGTVSGCFDWQKQTSEPSTNPVAAG
ncbi:vitamin B12 transporter BtuB domain protein [Candidatus Erwinia dacicola]|uniref:Vitamin B12 transporter BtuB domain protein n=1 Tax=Candidatus Erwinia dacicola TaxID=252393 RepID=A0A328TS85_9GAMM|nr:vitamin B12 transporter BtuB domain protein [Candidatus Erwinia dacicola]